MAVNLLMRTMLDRRALFQAAGALGVAGLFSGSAKAASFQGAADVQMLIDQRVAARQLPGAVVSLGHAAAPPEYAMGGTLDLESSVKVDENSLWRLASLTKPIAGMAAMLLIGEGKMKLDQPMADFIPGFATMRVVPDPKSSESRPAAGLITIRHLVTHTSGLTNTPPGTIGDAYRQLSVGGGPPPPGAAPVIGALQPPANLEEWANRMTMVPLAADPGTKWLYSPNLDLVGRIIEIVSGMPFDVFLERRMFLPLGMRSTYFWVPERDRGRLVTSYARRDGKLVATDGGATSRLLIKPRIPRGSGGLISSAHDYDRFMAMVINKGTLDGTTIIPAPAVQLGTSNLLPPGTDMSEYTSRTGFDGFGAGGMVTTGGRRPGTYGWGGSSGTTGFMNPQLKTRWGTFTNIGASDFGRRAMAAAGVEFGQASMPGGAER